MSRTFRRKGTDKQNAWWAFSELQKIEGIYKWEWVPLIKGTKEYKKKVAWYHSDSGCGSYAGKTAPRFYRRMCNKQATMKEKQEVNKVFKIIDYDPVTCPRVSSASYYW